MGVRHTRLVVCDMHVCVCCVGEAGQLSPQRYFDAVNVLHLSQQQWSRWRGCGNGWTSQEFNPATHWPSQASSLDLIMGLVLEELDAVNEV